MDARFLIAVLAACAAVQVRAQAVETRTPAPAASRTGAAPGPSGTPVANGSPPQATAPAPRRVVVDAVDVDERREPVVRHNVFEDGGSKVDELVVRGEVQHVVVTPKVGTTKPYEIIVSRGGRTPPDSTGGATSAVGKRVWNVLAF